MAENDKETGDDVNLEMPSLGFGSRRRKRKGGDPGGDAGGDTGGDTGEGIAAVEPNNEGKFVPPPPPSAPASPSSFRPPGEQILYADEVEDTGILPGAEEAKPVKSRKAPKAAKAARPPKPPKPPREKRELNLPEVSGMTVSIGTGVLVGLLACAATYAGLQGCESIKGTSSCGGPGFFLLVAILIMLVLVGGAVMKAFRVPDPGSTAFLAVGLLAVIVLLFLVGVIFEWWMVIVIPLIGAGTFALSHWVTTTFIEPADH